MSLGRPNAKQSNGKGGDSFADLMSFAGASSSRSNANALSGLSMKERAEHLKAEQAKKLEERKASQQMWASGLDALGGSSALGSGIATPNNLSFSSSLAPSPAPTPVPRVATSSPAPTTLPSLSSTPAPTAGTKRATQQPLQRTPANSSSVSLASSTTGSQLDFGFPAAQPLTASSTSSSTSQTPAPADDLDDIFDVFNKPPPPKPAPAPVTVPTPVPERLNPRANASNTSAASSASNGSRSSTPSNASSFNESSSSSNGNGYHRHRDHDSDSDLPRRPAPRKSAASDPRSEKQDHAIAELVDMGFTAEQSARALQHTDDGVNVRQAIDIIMMEAHRKATGKPPLEMDARRGSRGSPGSGSGHSDTPDISKIAQDLSSQLFSASKILFSQSKKTINKAISSYTTGPADDGTPAWMRDANRFKQQPDEHDFDLPRRPTPQRKQKTWDDDAPEVDISNLSLGSKKPSGSRPADRRSPDLITDEALALESGGSRRPSAPPSRRSASPPPMAPRPRKARAAGIPPNAHERFKDEFSDDEGSGSGAATPSTTATRSSPKLELSSSTPTSSARASPVPSLSRAQQFKTQAAKDEEDLFSYVSPARRKQQAAAAARSNSRASTPVNNKPFVSTIPDKPKAPPREPIAISSTALDMASTARESGTEAFKRGDYPQADIFYTQSLASLPPKHLMRTIVLSNRAASYMKLGNSKAALADAKEGLEIVGPALGADEFAEPGKPLKDIWSKLAQRQAEALESLERFKESLDSWNLLIENGFTSKTALDSKRRCIAALEPKKPATPKPAPTAAPARPKPAAPARPAAPSAASKEALNKIRAANQKAEQEDAERYQLLDTVDGQIEAWRKGKEDNLRGLLASLDSVLWSDLAWKKVSMAELVMPKKVKISYMKAVAKTHPDKVPASATTQQKMIAQAVFVTINKAWDGFKVANGLS